MKNMIKGEKNQKFHVYLKNLGMTEASDYNLWKATRRLKRPCIAITPVQIDQGNWTKNKKEKAQKFSDYLKGTFTPNYEDLTTANEEEL